MLPEAIINLERRRFSVDPTLADRYARWVHRAAAYRSADSVDCIETIRGWGDCGHRSVVLTGPMFAIDFGISKRLPVWSQASAEFRSTC